VLLAASRFTSRKIWLIRKILFDALTCTVKKMHSYEVIIVGAGPAGSATAIQLVNLAPELAGRVLLIDKFIFPRLKLCAGGVTNGANAIFELLGVSLDLPFVPVHTSKFVLPTGILSLNRESHFRIFRREELDEHLFHTAGARGIITRDGETVEGIIVGSNEVTVRTSKSEYKAKIIIGADGSNSTVRRLLGLPRTGRTMVAMETHIPLNGVHKSVRDKHTAFFDFSIIEENVQGYCWIFPAVSEDVAMASLGVMASPFSKDNQTSIKSAYRRWLARVAPGWKSYDLRAHPILRYEPRATCSSYRAILVGDALGVDPLFGEGITSALALGIFAAQSACDALANRDYSFSTYERSIRSSLIGKVLRRRQIAAHKLYRGRIPAGMQLQDSGVLDWIAPVGVRDGSATVIWTAAAH
jgi:geranylgeranyl reductase family protein